MKSIILRILILFVVLVVSAVSGYMTCREKSEQIKQAQSSVSLAASQSASMATSDGVLGAAGLGQSLPYLLEALGAASEEIDSCWLVSGSLVQASHAFSD